MFTNMKGMCSVGEHFGFILFQTSRRYRGFTVSHGVLVMFWARTPGLNNKPVQGSV